MGGQAGEPRCWDGAGMVLGWRATEDRGWQGGGEVAAVVRGQHAVSRRNDMSRLWGHRRRNGGVPFIELQKPAVQQIRT